MCDEEMEAAYGTAACYRRLWLDSEADLGLVAEQLAEVLGWQPTEDEMLPDPIELADVAAQRIAELERLLTGIGHRGPNRISSLHKTRIALN